MQQKKIIIFIITIFVISSVWLFHMSDSILSLNKGKNWWVLYFTDPASENLNFVIENHSKISNFHWEIEADKKKIIEGDLQIEKGSKAEPVQDFLKNNNLNANKITIKVSAEEDSREIYKNF